MIGNEDFLGHQQTPRKKLHKLKRKAWLIGMYKILQAEELTTNIFLMVVEAERVAKSCQPGQFIIVRMDEEGELSLIHI